MYINPDRVCLHIIDDWLREHIGRTLHTHEEVTNLLLDVRQVLQAAIEFNHAEKTN